MKLSELFINEMPVKISPLKSNLSDDLANETEVDLVNTFYPNDIIFQDGDKKIIYSDNRVWALEKIKNKERVTYKSIIEPFNTNCDMVSKNLGKSFRQKYLWKDKKSTFDGIAADMIFDVFLRDYDTIITDENQTKQGIDWWQKLLRIASTKGLTIGFIDCDKEVIDIFSHGNIEDWIKSKKAYTGRTSKHKMFFITKKKINT